MRRDHSPAYPPLALAWVTWLKSFPSIPIEIDRTATEALAVGSVAHGNIAVQALAVVAAHRVHVHALEELDAVAVDVPSGLRAESSEECGSDQQQRSAAAEARAEPAAAGGTHACARVTA